MSTHKNTHTEETYGEKSLHNISFDRAQRLVLDHHEDLLLFLQIDEIPKPRFFRKSENERPAWSEKTPMGSPRQIKTTHNDNSTIANTSRSFIILCKMCDTSCLLRAGKINLSVIGE